MSKKRRPPKRLYAVEVCAEHMHNGSFHDPIPDGKVLLLTAAEWHDLSKYLNKLATKPTDDHDDI